MNLYYTGKDGDAHKFAAASGMIYFKSEILSLDK